MRKFVWGFSILAALAETRTGRAMVLRQKYDAPTTATGPRGGTYKIVSPWEWRPPTFDPLTGNVSHVATAWGRYQRPKAKR